MSVDDQLEDGDPGDSDSENDRDDDDVDAEDGPNNF